MSGVLQMLELPLRQRSQVPSPWLNGTRTRSPFLKSFTSLPVSWTTPQNSCPMIIGIAGARPTHVQSPDHRCQSERQMPSAAVLMMAPLGGHCGSGMSLTTSGLRTPSITAAFIVSSLKRALRAGSGQSKKKSLSRQLLSAPARPPLLKVAAAPSTCGSLLRAPKRTGARPTTVVDLSYSARAARLANSFGSRCQRRERPLVAGEIRRVDLHAMQVGAGFSLRREPLARSYNVADVAHLVQQPSRNRLGPGLRSARHPRLANPAHVVTQTAARELFGVKRAHPRRIERQRGGLHGARAIRIAGHVNRARRLDRDGFGIAPGARRRGAKVRDRLLEPPQRYHHRQPSVGLLRGELDALAVERRDPDRNVLARRLEAKRKAALELGRLAVVVERLPGHQQVDDVHVLAHPGERRVEGDSVEMLDHLRSAGAEPDDHAAAAQFVERREVLRQRARRARVSVDDPGRQLDAFRMLCEQGERGKGVAAPRLGDPNRIYAGVVGGPRALDQPLEIRLALPIDAECNPVSHRFTNPRCVLRFLLVAPWRRYCRARICSSAGRRTRSVHEAIIGSQSGPVPHAFRKDPYQLNCLMRVMWGGAALKPRLTLVFDRSLRAGRQRS